MSGAPRSGDDTSAGAACSVQQIKFDCISYIKEFGADAGQWVGGSCAISRDELFRLHAIDPVGDVWLWKPAMSTAAARTVARFLQGRLGVGAGTAADAGEGRFVFLFRRSPALP